MEIFTVKVVCLECGEENAVDLNNHSLDGAVVDLTNIHGFYKRLSCKSCGEKRCSMWSIDGTLLIDGRNVMSCAVCKYPIIEPRLDASPGTDKCVLCAAPQPERHPHVKLPTIQDKFTVPEIPDKLRKCPKGHRTEIRMNNTTGEFFIGCSEFPKCWWRQSIPKSSSSGAL